MTTKVSIRSSVKNQVPQFVLEDHPLFVKFLEAYYEFLEQKGMSADYIRNSLTFLDADTTLQEFLDNLFEEVKDIPNTIAADKRLLAKHAYDLYRSKGTINGLKLLFRILYNEEIDVYLPKLDILRVSDGKWSRDFVLRVREVSGDPFKLIGVTIRQPDDVVDPLFEDFDDSTVEPASAIVENVIKREFGSEIFYDIYLNPESIIGTFSVDQIIAGNSNLESEQNIMIKVMTLGLPTIVSYANRGSYYKESQKLFLYDSTGQEFDGFVNGVGSGEVEEVFILDRGTGYSVGDFLNVDNNGTGGGGLSVKVASVDSFGSIETLAILNNGQGYKSVPTVSGPTGKFLAFGERIGRITSVEIRDPGFGYNGVPSAYVPTNCYTTDIVGTFFENEQIELIEDSIILETGYSITLEDDSGIIINEIQIEEEIEATIREISDNQVEISGVLLDVRFVMEDSDDYILTEDELFIESETSSEDINFKSIRGTISGTTARILSANPADIGFTLNALNVSNNRYLNVDGKISEASKRIQDSRFYQDFSYVINSGQSFSTYKNILLKLMHPAGLAVFGAIRIESFVNQTLNLVGGIVDIIRQIIISYVNAKLRNVFFEIELEFESQVIVGPTYKSFEGFKFFIPSKYDILGNLQEQPLNVNIDQAYNTQMKDWGYYTFDQIYVYDENGNAVDYEKRRIFKFNESFVRRIYEAQVNKQVQFAKNEVVTTVSLRNFNPSFGGSRDFLDQNKFNLNEHEAFSVGTETTTLRSSNGSSEHRSYTIDTVSNYSIDYFSELNKRKRSPFVYPANVEIETI